MLGAAAVAAGAGPVGGALFEREAEIAALKAVLESAVVGRGNAALVAGPAGIGKSRLVEAAVASARAQGMEPLHARAVEAERDFPFALVLQLFEARLRSVSESERRNLLEGSAGLAAPLLEPGGVSQALAPSGQLFPLIHGLYWFVANLAERKPLALAVDDVHACDEPSLRFLFYLSQRLEALPVALVISTRLGDPEAQPQLLELGRSLRVPVLRPSPLSLEGVQALVEQDLGRGVSEGFGEACLEVTGGNPFLVRELLAALAAEGIDEHSVSLERVRSLTPQAVTQRLLLRLSRLPDAAPPIARALSILSDGTPLRLCAELAGVSLAQTAPAIDALVGADIVRPPDEHEQLRFVHPLVRSALYEDQPAGERMSAHARAVALLLREGAPLAQIVPHLLRSQRGVEARAVPLLSGAAADAMRQGAPEAAANFLSRALEEPVEPDGYAALLLELGRAQFAAGNVPAAEDAAANAARVARDPRQRAHARLILGRVLYAQARHGEAAAAFEKGLAEIDPEIDSQLSDELRAAYATAATLDASLAPRGLAIAELIVNEQSGEPTLSERAVFAQLAAKRGFAAAPREEILMLAERAWDDGKLLEAEGADGPLWTLVTVALACADYVERGIEICSAVLDAARASGSVLAFATASYCRIWPLFRLGRTDEAIADAETAIAARRHGWEQHVGSAAAMLAHALIEKGELEAAADALAPMHEPEMKSRVDYALLLEARARLALARGDSQAALRDAEEAGQLFNDVFAMRAPLFERRPTEALAAAAAGDAARARAVAEELLELTRSIGAPGMVGRALRLRGLIEPSERSIEFLAEAVAVLETAAPRLEHVRALVDYGAALRRAGHRKAAREPLSQGFELATRGGARALAERARVELAALGARPRKDITARDRLTPSERRIAEMAASGMTNKQIAQALFVTLKTVEGHLHHAYQKLDIESRAQLSDALPARSGSAG